MDLKYLGSLILGVFVLGGIWLFASTKTENQTNNDWKKVDTDSFTVSIPKNWQYVKKQGIDSFIGDFTGDGVTLSFDYGWYAAKPEKAKDPEYTVNEEKISGIPAIIVKPKGSKPGFIGVYFEKIGESDKELNTTNSFSMQGINLTPEQQTTATKIFKSLKFTN